MSNREVIEWLKKKAEVVTMPGARKMYQAAAKALEAQNVAEKALDEYEYNGKTLREWIEIISASEHGANLAEVGTEAVSRRSVIDAVRAALLSWSFMPEWRDNKIIEAVEQLPPIQPKRGKWIKISPANIYECSECGKSVMTNDICAYDFCHGCGADMREVNHESN